MANEYVTTNMRAFQEAAARNMTEGLSSDSSVSVTYTHVPSRTLNTTTLVQSEGSNVSAAITAHRIEWRAKPGGQMQQDGDVAFLIEKRRLDDQSITEPTMNDRIASGSIVYTVLRWTLCGSSLRYCIYCKKVAT